ncbi:MAG: NTP transferase domain-containing protein [Anaerolineae bacterium]|nr:NTP transferase domain-containing protein [Anaerolineae bacterium]
MTVATMLLAAGHGTRMNSKTQKVLHAAGGQPMIVHVFQAAGEVSDLKPVLVVGAGEDGVRRLLGERATYVIQEERLGTGHATLMAEPVLRGRADQVIVTYGDMPLLRANSLAMLASRQRESGAAAVLLSFDGNPGSSFGRVIRAADGTVREIVEVAEARQREDSAALLAVRELNAGVYCFDGPWLWENLPELPLRQARDGEEYYLTDMVGLAVSQGRRVEAVVGDDPDEFLGAGTRAELVAVEQAFRRRANRHWLEAGVTLVDPNTTFIDQDVFIGQDTVIWPNSYIQAGSRVGNDCVIGPNTILRNARVGDGCYLEQVVVEDSEIAAGARIAPCTHLQGNHPAANEEASS